MLQLNARVDRPGLVKPPGLARFAVSIQQIGLFFQHRFSTLVPHFMQNSASAGLS
jgi:hypothetical protein